MIKRERRLGRYYLKSIWKYKEILSELKKIMVKFFKHKAVDGMEYLERLVSLLIDFILKIEDRRLKINDIIEREMHMPHENWGRDTAREVISEIKNEERDIKKLIRKAEIPHISGFLKLWRSFKDGNVSQTWLRTTREELERVEWHNDPFERVGTGTNLLIESIYYIPSAIIRPSLIKHTKTKDFQIFRFVFLFL